MAEKILMIFWSQLFLIIIFFINIRGWGFFLFFLNVVI